MGIGGLFGIGISENEKGEKGWYGVNGDIEVVDNKVCGVVWYDIGERLREEDFGSRVWECIEEGNREGLGLLVKELLKKGMCRYESRISFKRVNMRLEGRKVLMEMNYVINESGREEVLGISYDRCENILKG